MLRRCLLISCLSLSSIALYSCKNSDSKSAPTTATANQKKLGKNLSLNFDSFIGEDFNYSISGEKKCETDNNQLPFNNENSILINENEECTIAIHELKATGKTDNKIFIFSPKIANKYLILKISSDGKLTTPSPVLYISNEDNFEKYLAAKLNGDSLNLVLNTLSYIETKLSAEIDDLLAKAPEAPNAERTLNLAVTINSATLPANLIAIEKTAKFTRKYASQYELVTNSMKLKTTLGEVANSSNCKITDQLDLSQFTKNDFLQLSDCSQNLEFNKAYTVLFSEDSSWNLETIKIGSIPAVSPQISVEDMPNIPEETLKQEEKTLNDKFKIALDKYTGNFLVKYNALDKKTQSDKITILNTKLKAYYRKLDDAYKDRSDKEYVSQGFVLQNNEIEKIEIVDLTPQDSSISLNETSDLNNKEQIPAVQEETASASDDNTIKKEEVKNEDDTQKEAKEEEHNTLIDNAKSEEEGTNDTEVIENEKTQENHESEGNEDSQVEKTNENKDTKNNKVIDEKLIEPSEQEQPNNQNNNESTEHSDKGVENIED